MPPIATLLASALAAAPDEVVFWSGAGISADPPTSGPVGNALAHRALDHAFAPGTGATIAGYHAKLRLRRQRPRLETLLDIVYRVHGPILDDLLSDLAAAEPNALHAFFAEHLMAGGRHITANFDTCIERAAPAGATVDVIHFHGSFASAPLGATLARIERGFPPGVRDGLEHALTPTSTKLVVFVGYSGLDFFDVDPFLRALPAESRAGQTVLWVNHSLDPAQLVPPDRRQLEWLKAAGASTVELKAFTRDALHEFASTWGLAIRNRPGSAAGWRPTLAVTDTDKERATLALYALMNLHKEVHARVSAPSSAYEWEVLAHALWAEGAYGAAGDAWLRARSGAMEIARRERRGAIFWIRGEFGKARRELVEALADKTAPLDDRLVVAESLARVLVHMRRFPDSRLVPTRRVREQALAHLPDPNGLAAAGRPLGTHLRIRVTSARAALGAGGTRDDDAIESFGEYEALGGQLNYRHATLRGRLRRERVDPAEVRELRGDFIAIGAYGDAARTALLGGVGMFGWREVFRSAVALDITRWHRVRMLFASLIPSAARKLRGLA